MALDNLRLDLCMGSLNVKWGCWQFFPMLGFVTFALFMFQIFQSRHLNSYLFHFHQANYLLCLSFQQLSSFSVLTLFNKWFWFNNGKKTPINSSTTLEMRSLLKIATATEKKFFIQSTLIFYTGQIWILDTYKIRLISLLMGECSFWNWDHWLIPQAWLKKKAFPKQCMQYH